MKTSRPVYLSQIRSMRAILEALRWNGNAMQLCDNMSVAHWLVVRKSEINKSQQFLLIKLSFIIKIHKVYNIYYSI